MLKSSWMMACSGHSNAVCSGIQSKHGSVPNVTSLLHRSSIVALVLIFSQPALAQTKTSPFVAQETHARAGLSGPSSEKKIEALLRKMTLEEKVGQLVQYSAGQPTGPGTGRTDYDDMIRKGDQLPPSGSCRRNPCGRFPGPLPVPRSIGRVSAPFPPASAVLGSRALVS